LQLLLAERCLQSTHSHPHHSLFTAPGTSQYPNSIYHLGTWEQLST